MKRTLYVLCIGLTLMGASTLWAAPVSQTDQPPSVKGQTATTTEHVKSKTAVKTQPKARVVKPHLVAPARSSAKSKSKHADHETKGAAGTR